jgi:hypothetical protein
MNSKVIKKLENEVERILFLQGKKETNFLGARNQLMESCENFNKCTDEEDALLVFASAYLFLDSLYKAREFAQPKNEEKTLEDVAD